MAGRTALGSVADEGFRDPHWEAPLNTHAALRQVPPSSMIAGMFMSPTASAARLRGTPLPSARDRYLPFRFYPLREHVLLLIEACEVMFPHDPVRIALRKLGRAAPSALVNSTIGRVTLGVAEGVTGALDAIAKTYPINVRPSSVQVLDSSPGRFMVRFENLCFFPDSHHVGVLEGAMRYAGSKGRVRIRVRGANDVDMLCTW